jgi:predicted nucleotidyltransferase
MGLPGGNPGPEGGPPDAGGPSAEARPVGKRSGGPCLGDPPGRTASVAAESGADRAGGVQMKSLEEIKRILQQHKEELRAKYKVEEIGVFGSYVRGQQKKRSDIDILVEFEVVPGLLKFIELEDYLSKLLGIKVDLVRKSSIREELRDTILQEVVML